MLFHGSYRLSFSDAQLRGGASIISHSAQASRGRIRCRAQSLTIVLYISAAFSHCLCSIVTLSAGSTEMHGSGNPSMYSGNRCINPPKRKRNVEEGCEGKARCGGEECPDLRHHADVSLRVRSSSEQVRIFYVLTAWSRSPRTAAPEHSACLCCVRIIHMSYIRPDDRCCPPQAVRYVNMVWNKAIWQSVSKPGRLNVGRALLLLRITAPFGWLKSTLVTCAAGSRVQSPS